MLHELASIDPVFLLAVPASLVQGWYWQTKRDAAIARAMRRHPSSR